MDTVYAIHLLIKEVGDLKKAFTTFTEILGKKNFEGRKVYSSTDAAFFLGIAKSTLDKLCSSRGIKYYKEGKLRRFKEEDLLAHAFKVGIKTRTEMEKEVCHGK